MVFHKTIGPMFVLKAINICHHLYHLNHMFTVDLDVDTRSYFTAATMNIAVPSV